MAVPILIDTDMGIDDAVATCLAITADTLDVQAIVGVGGNVPIEQVVANIGRLLAATRPPTIPSIGRGLDQSAAGLTDRRALFGADGFGECDLPAAQSAKCEDFRSAYRRAITDASGELVILALGPLTNLSAMLTESPELMRAVKHIHVSGGAVWTRGNAAPNLTGPQRGEAGMSASPVAEFNMHRDPVAAAKVLTSGLPITVAPLDVTGLVCLDESHVAHLAASGYRTGEVLAKLLRYPLDAELRPPHQDLEPGSGKCHVHDALTTGSLLWPDLFLKTRMRLDVVTDGAQAGRTKPALGGDAAQRIDLLTAVNAVDFVERMLESLCHEAFVV